MHRLSPETSVATIREILDGQGDGNANVRCPVPDHGRGRGDRNPSLSVNEGRSGPVFHCHAGCDQADVFAAVTMRLEQAGYSLLHEPPEPMPPSAVASSGASVPGGPTRDATQYNCTGPDGSRTHYRADRPDGKKIWWAKGGPAPRRLLFRVREEVERDDKRPFLVTEGEKAALAAAEKLNRWCHVFATATGDSSQPDPDVWKHHGFFRRRVLLWPDNDDGGRRHMERVAADLRKLECKVQFVDPQKLSLPPKGDAADWSVSASQEAGQLLKQATVDLKPDHVRAFRPLAEDDAGDQETQPIVRNVAWPGRLTAIHGPAGSGKTRLLADAAAAVTRGDQWLGKPTIEGGGRVLWIAFEDLQGARKLLLKHGANKDRLIIGEGQALFAEGSWARTLPDVFKEFQPILIVVDSLPSLAATSGENVDSNNADDVTRLLQPLVDVARDRAAAALTHHEPHSEKRLRNSSAIAAVVDVVVRVARESQSSRVTVITRGTKARYGLASDPRLRAVLSPDGTRFYLEAQAPDVPPDVAPDALAVPGSSSSSDLALAKRILEFLEGSPDAKRRDIETAMGVRAEVVRRVLTGMVDQGLLTKCGSSIKGNPARYSVRTKDAGPDG